MAGTVGVTVVLVDTVDEVELVLLDESSEAEVVVATPPVVVEVDDEGVDESSPTVVDVAA